MSFLIVKLFFFVLLDVKIIFFGKVFIIVVICFFDVLSSFFDLVLK